MVVFSLESVKIRLSSPECSVIPLPYNAVLSIKRLYTKGYDTREAFEGLEHKSLELCQTALNPQYAARGVLKDY